MAALVLLTLAAPVPLRAEVINKILATVDGEPITLYQLKQFAQRSIRGRQLGESIDPSVVLEALITDKVIELEVADMGIVVKDVDVDRYIENIKERNRITDEQLEEALQAQGLTLEAYRKQVRDEIQRQQLVNREIRGKVSVTPEEVERYYQAHLADYATPGKLQIAHILFVLEPDAPPEQVTVVTANAEAVYQQIQAGADFAEMAQIHSEDATGQDGGMLGWFEQGELFDSLETAAMSLEVGEVSAPVRSEIGVHIVKLEGREEASHQALDELADQIKEELYAAALEERFQKWLSEELRKRHHVEFLQ